MNGDTTSRSKYGTVGLNVGFVGRWGRLVYGIVILVPLIIQSIQGFSKSNELIIFYGSAIAYLIGITAAYVAVYYLLGEKVFSRGNAWLNTAILVGPAILAGLWNPLFSQTTGFVLPGAFMLALTVYIGVSLILEWKIKYGGCEVVAIPIILLGRRYTTYCFPIVAVDAVEKVVVDKKAKSPSR